MIATLNEIHERDDEADAKLKKVKFLNFECD
jgi:hypothetical protein